MKSNYTQTTMVLSMELRTVENLTSAWARRLGPHWLKGGGQQEIHDRRVFGQGRWKDRNFCFFKKKSNGWYGIEPKIAR
jgi:hypothetical protein